jgi:gamma-glutamylcyclotransferase (GGCT)/AIG2-like uncharacterized protein YtfP
MNRRCPDNKFIKRAYLDNYKFVYDGHSKNWEGGAVANILESAYSIVWGGLYEISKSDLESLDNCEGFPDSYDRKELKVEDDHGNICKAITYFRIGEKIGIPSDKYKKIIIDGAKDCNLPDDYVKKNLI